MKKKVLITVISVLSFVGLLFMTANLLGQKHEFKRYVEDEYEKEIGGGNSKCDLEIYSRREYVHHAVEDWEIIKPSANINAGGKFGGWGQNFYFGAYSHVTQSVERPICRPYRCNICEKSHLNKAKRYF